MKINKETMDLIMTNMIESVFLAAVIYFSLNELLPGWTLMASSVVIVIAMNGVPLFNKFVEDNTPALWPETNWNNGTFKVYASLGTFGDVTTKRRYAGLISDAVSAWNECANIQIECTNDVSKAQIRIYFQNVPGATWAGNTTNNNYKYSLPIVLNTYYLNMSDDTVVLAVIEHELGHAMGLGHAQGKYSVMYPIAQSRTITALDRFTIDKLYK